MYSLAQRKILAGLGVDLWVLRGVDGGVDRAGDGVDGGAQPALERESLTETRTQTADVEPAANVPAEPVSEATLRLDLLGLRCESALVIGAMPAPEDRRLARDLLVTAAGQSKAEIAQTSFRWPQSSRGDAGSGAARSAFDGFLRGQIERAGVNLIILLGDPLRPLFPPVLPPATDANQWAALPGARCLLAASTEQLRNSAQHKRDLWHTLLTIPPLA